MSETKTFIYEIGGKKYFQRPLVLGQIMQLIGLLKGLAIPKDIDVLGLVSMLGERLCPAIAIVLSSDEVSLKDKDIATVEAEIKFVISPEVAIQVVEDFFSCNPIASLFGKLSGMAESLSKKITTEDLSKTSSASLQEEISPKGGISYGDTASESAPPTSNTGSEKSSSESQ